MLTPEVIKSLSVSEKIHVIHVLDKAAGLEPGDYAHRFESYYAEVLDRIDGYARDLGDGIITPQRFRQFMLGTLRRSYADAYRYGLGASGARAMLSDQDLGVVRSILTENSDYLSRFVGQFKDGYVPITPEDRANVTGRMLLGDRAELYAHSIRGAYFAGFTARGDALDKYDWLLGVTEHCEPCISMAEGSPYTKLELGGRKPGPDVCSGLTRCACSLVKHGDAAGYLRHLLAAADRITEDAP